MKSKANLRQLTKDEAIELDNIKLSAFLSFKPLCPLTDENIFKAVATKSSIPKQFRNLKDVSTSTENYKKIVIGTYIQSVIEQK